MGADKNKGVQGIEDVKFHKGKNGAVVIEVQGSVFSDVDLKKLKESLEGQKEKFKEVKINSQVKAQMEAKEAVASKYPHQDAHPRDHGRPMATGAVASRDIEQNGIG